MVHILRIVSVGYQIDKFNIQFDTAVVLLPIIIPDLTKVIYTQSGLTAKAP